jgi:hypothetical protein
MGEFTQNLLKLTEFPFSYSLIGLLALISGQGINVEELSFAQVGPLLILMGFVATTLSICDPLGATQRRIIQGLETDWRKINDSSELFNVVIFGKTIEFHFRRPGMHGDQYLNAILHTPEGLKELYQGGTIPLYGIHDLGREALGDMVYLLEGLKRSAVRTKWVTAEIDRITALIYFIIVVTVFVVAVGIDPHFLPNFVIISEDNQVTKVILLTFSIGTLASVSYVLILKMLALQEKASITFRYLTSLETIRAGRESFRGTLEEIERYLNDNDWTLADYWGRRLQMEYSRFYWEELKRINATTDPGVSR